MALILLVILLDTVKWNLFMRKIRYKKGRKVQPLHLEYTGIHKSNESEMQLFVYDDSELTEFEKIKVADFTKSIAPQKTWT